MKGEKSGGERRNSSAREIKKWSLAISRDFVSIFLLHKPYYLAPFKGVKKDGLGSVSLGSTTLGPPGNDEEKVIQLNAADM